MAWKSGSAAALRNRNEKERQEKTVMATAAGGQNPSVSARALTVATR